MVRATAFFSLVLVAAGVAGAGISGLPSVTDGDTLRIGPERIRLHGIDAPESAQSCRAGGKTRAGPRGLDRDRDLISGIF